MYRSQDEEDDEKADEDKADSDAEDSKDSDDEKHVRNSFLRPDQAFVISLCLCPHTPVVMKCHLQDEL